MTETTILAALPALLVYAEQSLLQVLGGVPTTKLGLSDLVARRRPLDDRY